MQLIATNSLPNFYLPAKMTCQESMMLKMHCTRLQHWTISRLWMHFVHEHRVLSTEMHKDIIQSHQEKVGRNTMDIYGLFRIHMEQNGKVWKSDK